MRHNGSDDYAVRSRPALPAARQDKGVARQRRREIVDFASLSAGEGSNASRSSMNHHERLVLSKTFVAAINGRRPLPTAASSLSIGYQPFPGCSPWTLCRECIRNTNQTRVVESMHRASLALKGMSRRPFKDQSCTTQGSYEPNLHCVFAPNGGGSLRRLPLAGGEPYVRSL